MTTRIEKEPSSSLGKIKITPLAAESFGVRSMCTLVETLEVKVLLDAGVSLCPYRFNLPPHPIEFQTIANIRKLIASAATKADVVTISHYHFDHHTPSYEDWVVNWTEENETARQIYQNKIVLVKNPREKINASQGNVPGFSKKLVASTERALRLLMANIFLWKDCVAVFGGCGSWVGGFDAGLDHNGCF